MSFLPLFNSNVKVIHFRELFERYLPGDQSYQCALWAFGEDFEEIPLPFLVDRWNDIHYELFILDGQGNIEVDIPRIIEAWKEKGHRNCSDTPKTNDLNSQ